MSLIFDALQRAEAERSGVATSTLSEAADVLQLAERHAISQRKAANQFGAADAEQSAERDTALPRNGIPPSATAVKSPLTAEPLPNDRQLDVFDQFASVEVSPPLENHLVSFRDGDSLAAEKFRFLGVRLQQLRRDRPLKKLLITSTIPQEGKSMVAANLACTLARRTHQKTLLVEGDVRRPALSQMFGLARIPGICEWLQGEADLTKSVYHLEGPGLWILPSGSTNKNPLELFQTGRLSPMMDQLTALFDWVIIDSPPVMPLADTSVWMRLADGILLVARQGITEKRQLQRGLEAIEPKKLIGALLNGSKTAAASDYYYTPAQP